MSIEEKRKALDSARKTAAKAEAAVEARDHAARQLDVEAVAARERVTAAERELKQAESAELRARLDAADAKVGETLAAVLAEVSRFAGAVNAAHEAQAKADDARRALGLAVGARDTVEAVALGALVDAGAIDPRSVGIPVTALRRLDPTREAERQRRAELDRAAREEADRRYFEREDVIRHEIAILNKRISEYRQHANKRSVRERLDEAVRERAAHVQKLVGLGYEVEDELVA